MEIREIKESNQQLLNSMIKRRYDLTFAHSALRYDFLKAEQKLLRTCEEIDDEITGLLETLKKSMDLDDDWKFDPSQKAFVKGE